MDNFCIILYGVMRSHMYVCMYVCMYNYYNHNNYTKAILLL